MPAAWALTLRRYVTGKNVSKWPTHSESCALRYLSAWQMWSRQSYLVPPTEKDVAFFPQSWPALGRRPSFSGLPGTFIPAGEEARTWNTQSQSSFRNPWRCTYFHYSICLHWMVRNQAYEDVYLCIQLVKKKKPLSSQPATGGNAASCMLLPRCKAV
jgi:hypothetical protein